MSESKLAQITAAASSRRELLKRAAAAGASAAALPVISTRGAFAQGRAVSGNRSTASRHQADATTLTIAAYGSPSDLDPHSAYDYRSVMAILGAYEGLIQLKDDKTDVYEGLVAESWEANEDKSIWTFHIRDGLTFHDGSVLDAEAVRLSFERFLTLGIGPVGVIKRFVDDASQITAPDEKTVIFNLGRPQPRFEAAIASTYGPPIVNAKLLKEKEGDWGHDFAETNEEGCGSGAYRITQFEPGTIVVMERFENYWKGWDGPHFEKIVIRVTPEAETRRQLIEQGDADIVDELTSQALDALQTNPDVTVLEQFTTQVQYYYFAIAGPLASIEARQALCYAYPYNEVIEGVYKGGRAKQAHGAVPEILKGYDPDTFQYTTDLVKAKELLSKAGIAEGTELTLAIETGSENAKSEAQLFQASLEQIGLKLTIDQMETSVYTQVIYGDSPADERPNLMIWSWWPDYNDAWNHLDPQIDCDKQGSAGANAGYYCNQKVDELMKASKDAVDEATYDKALSEIQQIITRDDPPALYSIEPIWTTVTRKDVTGVFINPINIGTFNFWSMTRTT